MTLHQDFERIKEEFGPDANISYADFCELKAQEMDELVERVSSISNKGTLRRIYHLAQACKNR